MLNSSWLQRIKPVNMWDCLLAAQKLLFLWRNEIFYAKAVRGADEALVRLSERWYFWYFCCWIVFILWRNLFLIVVFSLNHLWLLEGQCLKICFLGLKLGSVLTLFGVSFLLFSSFQTFSLLVCELVPPLPPPSSPSVTSPCKWRTSGCDSRPIKHKGSGFALGESHSGKPIMAGPGLFMHSFRADIGARLGSEGHSFRCKANIHST